ncbi:hypothetical protein [Streptomyces sp. NPDC046197]|uniref:hypothetical protein n=1 Tax=Streptomyces sp. NPDC046197 TaxID=3154337 RepID=UPI00340A8BC8
MGIRMLNHRPTVARADAEAAPRTPPPPVPVFAADASTARIPADLTRTLRRAVTDLRRRLTPGVPGPGEASPWRLWADMARGYLALLLVRLPRPGPGPTFTVFVATATPVTGRTGGPHPFRPHRNHRDG